MINLCSRVTGSKNRLYQLNLTSEINKKKSDVGIRIFNYCPSKWAFADESGMEFCRGSDRVTHSRSLNYILGSPDSTQIVLGDTTHNKKLFQHCKVHKFTICE